MSDGYDWIDELIDTDPIKLGVVCREYEREIRRLMRVVATMVDSIDADGVVTTAGGDRFAFLTDSTISIRQALEAFAEERESDRESEA